MLLGRVAAGGGPCAVGAAGLDEFSVRRSCSQAFANTASGSGTTSYSSATAARCRPTATSHTSTPARSSEAVAIWFWPKQIVRPRPVRSCLLT